MRWPSPWSDGFPGWHLECTAMSTKYLGDTFDIHGGGMDLKFPHHECEIAQNKACSGHNPVNYWLHANMLTLNGKKMAKSTGNNILPREIFTGDSPFLSKAYHPSIVRFFMLQAHYRSILDFSDEAVGAAEKGFQKLMEAYKNTSQLQAQSTSSIDLNIWIKACYDAMNDDFNSPILIAQLFEGVRYVNLVLTNQATLTATDIATLQKTLHDFIFDVLGLKNNTSVTTDDSKMNQVMQMLIEMRNEARANKDFSLSDQIRDKLLATGIQLKDGKDGTSYLIN